MSNQPALRASLDSMEFPDRIITVAARANPKRGYEAADKFSVSIRDLVKTSPWLQAEVREKLDAPRPRQLTNKPPISIFWRRQYEVGMYISWTKDALLRLDLSEQTQLSDDLKNATSRQQLYATLLSLYCLGDKLQDNAFKRVIVDTLELELNYDHTWHFLYYALSVETVEAVWKTDAQLPIRNFIIEAIITHADAEVMDEFTTRSPYPEQFKKMLADTLQQQRSKQSKPVRFNDNHEQASVVPARETGNENVDAPQEADTNMTDAPIESGNQAANATRESAGHAGTSDQITKQTIEVSMEMLNQMMDSFAQSANRLVDAVNQTGNRMVDASNRNTDQIIDALNRNNNRMPTQMNQNGNSSARSRITPCMTVSEVIPVPPRAADATATPNGRYAAQPLGSDIAVAGSAATILNSFYPPSVNDPASALMFGNDPFASTGPFSHYNSSFYAGAHTDPFTGDDASNDPDTMFPEAPSSRGSSFFDEQIASLLGEGE